MTNYQFINDDELLKLLNHSDKGAFTELFNRYWEKLITVAYIKLRSSDQAEEVVQNLFIDIWNRRSKIEVHSSFYTYVCGALKYKIYSFIAKEKKEKENLNQLSTKSISRNTEEWLSYEALKDDLEKAVLKLPEKCQLVFRLSREAGYSNKEIAQQLNISNKTVESHITKALGHLQGALKSFFFFFF